jgi:alanyl-tRNA synthetase
MMKKDDSRKEVIAMTKRLYYVSPSTVNWTTTITSIKKEHNDYLITLAETAFYPEGGGQPSDLGTIDGIKVIDVFEEDGEVYHRLPALPNYSTVNCQIDWHRRLDHTQQHSGQHLLSAVCIELFDAHTVSFHLGKETVTIDLNISHLSAQQLKAIEERVNELIYRNVPVKTYFVSKEEARNLPFRKFPDIEEPIRVVEMQGIDISACCGTHVSQTGEIGIIKLLKTEKHRGLTRLHFKCGTRALADYSNAHNIVTKMAQHLGTNRETLLDKIVKLEEENKLLHKELEHLKGELHDFEADKLIQNHHHSLIVQVYDNKTMKDLQAIAQRITAKQDKVVILATALENRLVAAKSAAFPFHIGQLFKEQQAHFHGKGGGNERQAQMTFTNSTDLTAFMNSLQTEIERLIIK